MFGRRLLAPAERMVDVFDRGATLNFLVVAQVNGPLSADRLESALRRLESRHPLLRARVERSEGGVAFVPGEARPIPLRVLEGPAGAWRALAEEGLTHRVWDDAGPRAELTWLRHSPCESSLLLLFHHLVSDGSSGMFAMRDLLRLAAQPGLALAPIPAPAPSRFYPAGHGSLGWQLRTLRMLVASMFGPKPQRLRVEPRGARKPEPEGARTPRLARLRIPREESARLLQRARRDGATVHGVLSAAFARAVASQLGAGPAVERILHPVDMRRYARAHHPGLATPGEAVGYYVSSMETNHRVDPSSPLAPLAREVTQQIRDGKARGTPLMTAPIAGPMLSKRHERTAGDLPRFRDFVETKVVFDTFSLTNLGPLEQLGLEPSYGELTVADVYFVAAGSVLSTLGGAVTTFGGALTLTIGWVEPLVAREVAERVVSRIEHELADYIGLATGALPCEANAP